MRIAFASCSNITMQNDTQPIWGIIQGQQPDLLLLLGDNVYMGPGSFNAVNLENKYKRQLAEPHFNKLLCDVPYLVTWDNHDFGLNVVGTNVMTSTERKISRDLFNEYLKYRSQRPYSPEVYCTYRIGNVKVIMLDVRSYQQLPGTNRTILGKTQEDWLINEMHEGNHSLTLICAGTTYSYRGKGWKPYKNWFDRFNREVARTPKPIFLGGGIHKNHFKQHIIRHQPITGISGDSTEGHINPPHTFLDRNFYEIISSGVGRNVQGHKTKPPLNKYGIIDINNSVVEITLYSQQANNFIHKVISRESWELVD